MSIGCTGTSRRTPTYDVGQRIAARLRELYACGEREFHHGDCIMMDEWLAVLAKSIGFTLVAHPPENSRKRAYVPSDITRAAKPYLERNHDIVDASTRLIACPDTENEELRSGTWATVRYARKRNVPVEVFV